MSLNTWRNIYIILLDDSSCLSRVILIWDCGSTGYEVYWVPHYVREDESYSVSRLSCSRRGWDLQCEQAQLQQAGHPPSQQTASSSLCSAPWFQPQPYSGTSSHSISPGVEGSLHYLFTLRFIQFQTGVRPLLYVSVFLNLGDFLVCQFEGVFLPRRDFRWFHLHLLAFTCSGIFSQRIGRNSGQLIWLVEDFRTRGTPGLQNCWLPSWLGCFESFEGNAGCLIPESDMAGGSWYTRWYMTRATLTDVFHFLQFDFPFPILLVWKKIHRLNAGSNSLPKLGYLLKWLLIVRLVRLWPCKLAAC